MIGKLKSILNFFEALWDFVTMLIESIINALLFIPELLNTFTSSIAYLPALLGVFATLSVTFLVVNYIAGRK